MTKDVNFEIVGKLLLLLREKSGKDQQEIARALNVSKAAVSLWESGNGIQTEKIYDLARYYNISVAELISGKLKDENEEDYLQRNYDLKNHPSFEKVDSNNVKDLLEYLSRCKNVLNRVFRLYPSYVSDSLNKKEENEFNVLMSYFQVDTDYVSYMNYGNFSSKIIDLIEKIKDIHGHDRLDLLDYELTKIYELKIEVNPFEVIAFSDDVAGKYLSLLKQQQKDILLTYYVDGKTTDEIETSVVIKRLLESGASCLFAGKDFLSPCENFDRNVLEGLEGKVVSNKIKNKIYKYFKTNEQKAYADTSRYFDPSSWKNLPEEKYEFLIDNERTEDIKSIVYLRVDKPKQYMEYLEQKYKKFKKITKREKTIC